MEPRRSVKCRGPIIITAVNQSGGNLHLFPVPSNQIWLVLLCRDSTLEFPRDGHKNHLKTVTGAAFAVYKGRCDQNLRHWANKIIEMIFLHFSDMVPGGVNSIKHLQTKMWMWMERVKWSYMKTLPKAQRTKGLSSYHKITVHKSWTYYNFRISIEH